jgi:hypothetical protein
LVSAVSATACARSSARVLRDCSVPPSPAIAINGSVPFGAMRTLTSPLGCSPLRWSTCSTAQSPNFALWQAWAICWMRGAICAASSCTCTSCS